MGLIRLGNKPPLTVTPDDTVVQAARAIMDRNVSAATVLDGAKLIGVVPERDVMQKIVAADRDPKITRVREIMSSPAVSVGLNTSVVEPAALMREKSTSAIGSSSTRTKGSSACSPCATCSTTFWTTLSAMLATLSAIS